MKTNLTKFFSGLTLVLILTAAAFLLSHLRIAFGWTNPNQAPPAGSGLITAANNNIGISNSNPTQKLSVNGTVESILGGFKFPDGTTQTSAASSVWNTSGTNGTNIYNTNSGNVGVGTPNPISKLDVNGSINSGSLKVNGNLEALLNIYLKSASPLIELRDTISSYPWWTIWESAGDLRIDSSTPTLTKNVVTFKNGSSGVSTTLEGTLKLNNGTIDECSLPRFVGAGKSTDGSKNPDCSNVTGAHVCSPEELLRSDRCNAKVTNDLLWVAARLKVEAKDAAGTNRTVTDCKSWTSNSSTDYGFRNVIVSKSGVYAGGYAEAVACNISNFAACCK